MKRAPTPAPDSPTPVQSEPSRIDHLKRRTVKPRLLTFILALTVLVVLGAFVGQRFLLAPPAPTSTSSTGAFAGPPLTAQQIAELHHLRDHLRYKQLASLYVARMTLAEKLGQLIMVEYDDESYSPDLDMMLRKYHAGGVIMYEFQMKTAEQTRSDIAQMQKNAQLPLLISTDEEGGIVHRLSNIYPPRSSALAIYQTGKPAVAEQEGHKVAHDLLNLGINVNLAPDIDVALVPDAPDQITRTFGFTVDSVIQYAGPYMRAMQKDGVLACIKHFPGLGAATVDAHEALPIINRTRAELYATELAPFKHFIQSPELLDHPGMIMPTDVLMPAIDPAMPAELSHTFMTDILRKEFGYDGVVLTDALYMQGVQINGKSVSMPEAGVMALNAGDDMLLGPTGVTQMEDMLTALKAASQNGTLSQERIDEAATRIIALKMERHLMPAVPPL